MKDNLNAENPDLFIDLGDIVPKEDKPSEGAITDHKELDKQLFDQEIPFIRLSGNYDVKAKSDIVSSLYEEDGFLEVLYHTSDFEFMALEAVAGENSDIVIEQGPTPHSYAVGVDDSLLIFSHTGLEGETPYASTTLGEEVDLNANLYFQGVFIPETLEANYSAMEQFAKEAEGDYQDLALLRGHEEIYDEWKRETDEHGLHTLKVGAYKHGDFATLETGNGINFNRREI